MYSTAAAKQAECPDTVTARETVQQPRIVSCGKTDPGKVRPTNQDHFLIAELARTMWVHGTSLPQPDVQYGAHRAHVFLVADGMGGHRAGEVASALAVETLEKFILNVLHRFSNVRAFEEESVAEEFKDALQQARLRLARETNEHPEYMGMGTTLTMAFLSGWRLFVVHAGDSRCYLYREGKLQQLTRDHTVVAELVRLGSLNEADAFRHAFRHVVTNAVGGTREHTQVDVHRMILRPDDTLLLCTDGLTDMLPVDRIEGILAAEEDPRSACDRLVAEANQEGGRDNITAVVGRFVACR